MQADVDDLAARFGLVSELGLEQNAQGLVGLQRRAQVGQAADELDGFADDRIRHSATDASAIDSIRDGKMRRWRLAPEGIVEQVGGYDRLGGLLITPVVLGGDGDDIFAVLKDRDLLDPILAREVQCADGQGRGLRRQRLDMGGRVLRGAFDHACAVGAVAVGDQEIADGVRHQRLEDGFLQLRLPARSTLVDLKLVAVRARQKLALGVGRRVGAPVIVRAVIGLVLSGRHLRRVRRQLDCERLGFLAGFLEFPHIAASGREQSRIDEKGLARGLRRLLPELRRDRDKSVLRRLNRAPSHKHRITRQVDNRRKPYSRLRTFDHRDWRGGIKRRRVGSRRHRSPCDEAHADTGDHNRGGQADGAATTAHAKLTPSAAGRADAVPDLAGRCERA